MQSIHHRSMNLGHWHQLDTCDNCGLPVPGMEKDTSVYWDHISSKQPHINNKSTVKLNDVGIAGTSLH